MTPGERRLPGPPTPPAPASPRLAHHDPADDDLTAAFVANSADSLVAYKDLYRVAESAGVAEGLAYEAATSYTIADTDNRLASFR